ncbi:MAG: Short-chain dehydrogenase/reductase prx6 [Cirrosporium novae-zelandiae]|nr:MAG: Short-chain dehydrogenase/reductase prx6 [Cirrosporium novae-zelandiae]
MTPIPEKVAIVTGATSGIGVDLTRHLISRGWKVACVGRRKEIGEKLADSLGRNAKFFRADVSDYASQAQMFSNVWKTWGRIDVLCANAGIVDRSSIYLFDWRGKSVEEVPPEPDLSCTDIDYKGVVYGTQLAIHYMRHNKVPGGKVIVTASIGGIFPHRAYPEYCGAKAAVIQFVRGVAPLLKTKDNISVNIVLPGIVATPIVPPEMIAAVTPEWYVALLLLLLYKQK